MSDVSTFVRRGQSNNETINKLQALITPLAFADPEADSLKERVILSSPIRLRALTALTGLDITTVSTATRTRTSSSLTIVPDTSSPSTFPVSPSTVGTLDFNIPKKYGAGARFSGTQYITTPDNNQFDLTLPYFTMAFWFKSTDGGSQTIYNKGDFNFDKDFCSICTDFSDDYSTSEDTTTTPGLQIRLESNSQKDFCDTCTDFDASYSTSTHNDRVRVVISDGTNLIDTTVDTGTIFNGNWHSIVLVSQDSVSDYCVACTDFSDDYASVSTPVITVYVDKVSRGTIDHSSITGDLSNSSNAIIGSQDTLLTNPLLGDLAIFEYNATNWTTANIASYHDDGRITVASQKLAFYFVGNDSTVDTLDKVY
jgi:hypothetical protein